MKLLGPVACIGFNFFKIQGDNQKFYDMLMMIMYYVVFQTQGIFDQFYSTQSNKYRDEILNSGRAPFFLGLCLFMLFLCEPNNYTGVGSLFVYPIYTDHNI